MNAPFQSPEAPYWGTLLRIGRGELHRASRELQGAAWRGTWRGRLLAWWLAGALMRRARWHREQLNPAAALDALDDARRICGRDRLAEILREQDQTAARIVEDCRRLIRSGNVEPALDQLELLHRRGIEPDGSGPLRDLALGCRAAEAFLHAGQPRAAIGLLEYLRPRQQDCPWMDARIRWLRRRHDRKGLDNTHPALLDRTVELRAVPGKALPTNTDSGQRTEVVFGLPRGSRGREPLRRLLLWIDGVGHYLICLEPEIWLGRYVPLSRVQVPLLADMQRRHLRMTRSGEGGFVLQSAGRISVDGEPEAVRSEEAGADGASRPRGGGCRIPSAGEFLVRLADSVSIACRSSRSAAGTLVMRMTSRHRTVPAADAVVWLGEDFVIGPEPEADIRCPDRRARVIVRRVEQGLAIRCAEGLTTAGTGGEWEAVAGGEPRGGDPNCWFGRPLRAGDHSLMLERLEDDQELPGGVSSACPAHRSPA